MKMKEESKKAGLKLNIRKTKIMASGPITSWQIDGETMQTMRDLIFFFKLYIIVLVLPNIKMNPPQVYMCSPSWRDLIFGAPKSLQMVIAAMKLKDACFLEEKLWPI